jgi:hypothetical protein
MNSPTPTSYKYSDDFFRYLLIFRSYSPLFTGFHICYAISRVQCCQKPEVTSSVDTDDGFLSVFNISFQSMAYSSQVLCVFSLVVNGGLSISAASRRPKPEETSSNDRVTTNTCFASTVRRSPVLCVSSLVFNGGLSISAARRRLEPEVASPFDSSTTISYKCRTHFLSSRRHPVVIEGCSLEHPDILWPVGTDELWLTSTRVHTRIRMQLTLALFSPFKIGVWAPIFYLGNKLIFDSIANCV